MADEPAPIEEQPVAEDALTAIAPEVLAVSVKSDVESVEMVWLVTAI